MLAVFDLARKSAIGGATNCHVLLPTDTFGGHENMLVEWLTEARRQGLNIQIYCKGIIELTRRCQLAGFQPDLSHYLVESRGSRWTRTCRDHLSTWRILGLLPRDAVVLFAPGAVQASPMHLLAAILRRRRVFSYVPMAYSSRFMRFRFATVRDWIVAQLVRKVVVWITITEQQRQLLVDQWRVPAPVHVVPNLLTLPGAPKAARPCPTSGGEPLRVLFIGRFEPNQKGLDWFSDQLREHSPSWNGHMCFTFQGQGEFESQLRLLSSECPPGAVIVAPWGDVALELSRADVLVLPSRFEGLPLVAIEATHHGVPVVATKQAGLSDVLHPESLFQFGDFDGLYRAMERLRDPQVRGVAVAHAQARMRAMFSRERFEQAVSAVVRDISDLATVGEPERTGR